jgi:hypothetical protein
MSKVYRVIAVIGSLVVVLAGTAAAGEGTRNASPGDPFAACVGVGTSPDGVNHPNTELEPWVAANPARPGNVVGTFQQDRWSDGGAKGLVASWSFDGGRSWSETPLPFSKCAAPFYGGAVLPYDRASDPWNDFGPDGTAYAVALGFNSTSNENAVGAATSSDGGVTWRNVRAIRADVDIDPNLGNDKESVTADPVHAAVAYVVWDRFDSVPCGPGARPATHAPRRERPARPARAAATTCYTAPTYFSRTTDGGVSWSKSTVIVPAAVNEQTIGNVIVVDRQTDVLYDFFLYIDTDNNFILEMVHTLGPGTARTLAWSAPVVIAVEDAPGVFDPRNADFLRTSQGDPAPAIDPVSGQLYVAWEDARFTGGANDQVVISTSPRGGAAWTAPKLVNPAADAAAFTPGIAVDDRGQVGVSYYALSRPLSRVPADVLPTDAWFARANGPSLQFGKREHLAGPFNSKAAPFAFGFFLGDYAGLTTLSRQDQGFLPFFAVTNCRDASCIAPGNPTGAPTGGSDPMDIVAVKLDQQGEGADK